MIGVARNKKQIDGFWDRMAAKLKSRKPANVRKCSVCGGAIYGTRTKHERCKR